VRLWIIALSGLLSAAAPAANYRLFQQDKPAGSMTVAIDGKRRTVTVSPEQARFVKSRSIILLDARGVPVGIDTTGTLPNGAPLFERLTVSGDRMRWETGLDKGEAAAGGYYLPLLSSGEPMAILARALLATTSRSLAVLPSGEVRIEQADRVDTSAGPADLFLISGLGRRPVPIWLDDKRELVAQLSVLEGSIVREGFETSLKPLLQRQEQRIVASEKALATSAVRHPDRPVLIRDANLYDAEAAVMRPGTDVLVRGKRITAVGRRLRVPRDAIIIDANGRALLPGLWDAHVHMFDPAEAMIMIANGITSARDMGNDDTATQGWRRQFDAGELIGPRLFLGAVVDGPGKRDISWGKEVRTEAEVDTLMTQLARQGFDTVKLFNNTSIALAPYIIDQAHRAGLRVGGHLPIGWTMDEAIAAGVDGSTHFDFVLMNFLPPIPRENYGAMKRLPLLIDGLQNFDPAQPRVDSTITAMRRRGVTLDPTMVAYEGFLRDKAGEPALYLAPYRERVPARQLRYSMGGGIARNAAEVARNETALKASLALLGRFAKAGVPLVAGGDGEPAIMIPRELEIYVEAGLTPLEALRAATINPARALRRDRDLGSVRPGKLADLVLVEGDLAQSVGVVRNTVWVMKNGAIYDLARLNAQVGMRPSPALARFTDQQGTRTGTRR